MGGEVYSIVNDAAGASVGVDMVGTLLSGGGFSTDSCGANRIVGPLCARDYKGVGNQYVNEGKLVTAMDSSGYIVRRLTPMECERLQGFPDDWTLIPYRGKPAEECPDGPRYKAIGNSMAVPVMKWIMDRMDEQLEGRQWVAS